MGPSVNAAPGVRLAAIDLNADLGEGVGEYGVDAAMLSIVTSANVACGFHAGDATTMREVCGLAAKSGVVLGAHVSYRDRENFGRIAMPVTARQLREDVTEQVRTLQHIAAGVGAEVRYVKPHGALYNVAAVDREQAACVVEAVAGLDASLLLLGLPDSELRRAAGEGGVGFVAEAFADRAYLPDGRLTPRTQDGAVLDDAAAVAQAVRIAREGVATARDGSTIPIEARSLCVHGDTPGAVEMARRIRAELADAGLTLAPFA